MGKSKNGKLGKLEMGKSKNGKLGKLENGKIEKWKTGETGKWKNRKMEKSKNGKWENRKMENGKIEKKKWTKKRRGAKPTPFLSLSFFYKIFGPIILTDVAPSTPASKFSIKSHLTSISLYSSHLAGIQ